MLPDFPIEKAKLMRFLNFYGEQKRQQHMGIFNEARSYRHYEGNLWRIEREDGSFSDSDYKLAEAGFSIHVDEIPNLTWEAIREKLDDAVQKMSEQVMKEFFRTLNQELESHGRVTSSEGREFDKDQFLNMLENLLM